MSTDPATGRGAKPTLRSVADHISAECAGIGEGLSHLQYLTGAITSASTADTETTVALQELDRLTQTAMAAARALTVLASRLPDEAADEPALRDAIGLPSVADRVLGTRPQSLHSVDHGKTDFF
ncbi:MAG: hypothetical protein AAGJ74_01190 [Pseudomonadota bacterium]